MKRKPTVVAAAIAAVACTSLFAGPANARTTPRPPAGRFTIAILYTPKDCGGLTPVITNGTARTVDFDLWAKSDRTFDPDPRYNRVGWVWVGSDTLAPGQSETWGGVNMGGSAWDNGEFEATVLDPTGTNDANVDPVTVLAVSADRPQPCG